MKAKTNLLTSAALAATILTPALSHAGLELSIDPIAKTLTFGSTTDSGTPTGPTGALATWQETAALSGSLNQTVNISSALLTDGTPAGNAELQVNADSSFIAISVFEGTSYTTITGTGASVSYASLDSTLQSGLEALAASNTPLALSNGTGFSSITTASVPEPSNYALGLGVAMIGLVVARRRGKR